MNAFFDEMAAEVIKWPSQQEIQQTSSEVFRRTRFPGVVDGTHIKIDKPTKHQESYCNRKHYHSIQVQIICDDKCKLIDVFIGYPGSVHDARVFSSSFIYPQLSELCQDGHLLGDSAYPCLDFCLTPYKDNGHLNRMQTRYNKVHSSLRIKVEHANGILKQRFRQLYHVKLRKIERVVALVKSCCVLHNLCQIQDKLLFDCEHNPLDITAIEDENVAVADTNMTFEARSGAAKRNYIASVI
ncbi:putative nuclease HARBI1 isoform X2 [Photinus pyralis]|uniref:putative nuclease HARBI1 isoform X2 n=1 Tax=Photinus pyralis TaxID=7054 RepID=UPI00126772F5|nr:putative nuclease HARBI1 isoform X2 [Photinus pyralis]XP_031341926.1 putative nuclease HARBI1 isoform X2 [Photinus pyralis]